MIAEVVGSQETTAQRDRTHVEPRESVKSHFIGPRAENLQKFIRTGLDRSMDFYESWLVDSTPFPKGEPDELKLQRLPEGVNEPDRVLKVLVKRLQKCRRLSATRISGLAPPPHLPSLVAAYITSFHNPNNVKDWWDDEEPSKWKTRSRDVTPNLEKESVKMLAADVIGYNSKDAGGNLVCDGTLANLTALLIARDKFYLQNHIGWGDFHKMSRTRVITTAAAHYFYDKIIRILGIGDQRNLVKIPIHSAQDVKAFEHDGKPFPLKPCLEDWENSIKKAREKRRVGPIAVVIAAGTTETMTLEPIGDVVSLKEKYGFFLHIDAAIGGFANLVPEIRTKMGGIEKADSVTVDPHKFGYVQYPCGAILFKKERDQELLRQTASYLKGIAPTIEGSRAGTSAAACWVALNSLGKEGYREIIRTCRRSAEYLARRLEEPNSGLQLLHTVDLSTVCFAVKKAGEKRKKLNDFSRGLKERMDSKERLPVAFLDDLLGDEGRSTGKVPIQGIRTVILNPWTSEDYIEHFLERLTYQRDELLKNVA